MRKRVQVLSPVGRWAILGWLLGLTLGLAASEPTKPKRACAKCHAKAAAAVTAEGSPHASVACADCHGEAHPPKGEKKAPSCAECHEGHGTAMAAADCARCHSGHRAREVKYGLDVPPAQCGACHDAALAALTATKSRHKPLRCVLCHQKEHGKTQDCAHCHGSPHPPEMVKAGDACGSCHGTAHDLGGGVSKASAAKGSR